MPSLRFAVTARLLRAAPALAALALTVPSPAVAQSRTYVEVGSPNFQPLPIAVIQFAAAGEGARAAAQEATEVVRGDLALSGLFDVLDPKGFLADPSEGFAASSIRFARWADVGAEGLVRARFRREGGELAGELHLYEVRAGREVLTKIVRGSGTTPRAMAHRMSDEIVRYYTREPGVFSTQIAAIRKARGLFELLLLDADGKSARVLLSEKNILLTPAWRPDGKEILLTSYRSGQPGLWAFGLADRSFRQVGQVPNSMGGVYSPDGTRIAFTATEAGNSSVWVMAADGSDPRRLTKDRALNLSPTWSPDGKRIAFVSDRVGTPQIYVMNADGSGVRRLTFQGNYNQTPQWSPRGDLIAFTARDERKVFDVFAVSPESGKIERLTQDQGRTNEEPSWAPNGRLVVFRTDRKGAGQLAVSDPKGERQTLVAGGVGDLSAPAWGPLVE